eukprot:767910-Hanusia_phi.AAC.3
MQEAPTAILKSGLSVSLFARSFARSLARFANQTGIDNRSLLPSSPLIIPQLYPTFDHVATSSIISSSSHSVPLAFTPLPQRLSLVPSLQSTTCTFTCFPLQSACKPHPHASSQRLPALVPSSPCLPSSPSLSSLPFSLSLSPPPSSSHLAVNSSRHGNRISKPKID